MCFSVKCAHSYVCLGSGLDCGGKVVQPPPWLTSRLPAEPQSPLPPSLLTPAEAAARFNTASTKQTQTPTVLLYVACSGCARRLVENPCLYLNHKTVDLQRETPAHARTTQNITDHLLNTEIEPHCNVKVWGYGGLAHPCTNSVHTFKCVKILGHTFLSLKFLRNLLENIKKVFGYMSYFCTKAWHLRLYTSGCKSLRRAGSLTSPLLHVPLYKPPARLSV